MNLGGKDKTIFEKKMVEHFPESKKNMKQIQTVKQEIFFFFNSHLIMSFSDFSEYQRRGQDF